MQQILGLDISVIIVNYNVRYFLEQCLSSLMEAMRGLEGEVIVVDNNSTDGSREYLEPKFPSVRFVWETTNHGFSKANNIGLGLSKGDHVLFLNPDTIIPEHAISYCIQKLRVDKSFGAAGVKMVSGNGTYLPESKRGFPTPAASFFKMTGLSKLFPGSKYFASYYQGHLSPDKASDIDVLAGAFMMLSRKAVIETAGFDEDFFMYGEDIDLSFRIKQCGLRNIYLPDVTIIHFKGESTQKKSKSYQQHFYGAMKLFVRKHYGTALKYRLLQVGIDIAKLMNKGKGEKKSSSQTNVNTCVIASQHDFDNILKIIKYAEPSFKIVRRADPNKNIATQLSQVDELHNVIFSGHSLSNAAIISNLQQLPKSLRYYFHLRNTSSIVSSPDKGQAGYVIAAGI